MRGNYQNGLVTEITIVVFESNTQYSTEHGGVWWVIVQNSTLFPIINRCPFHFNPIPRDISLNKGHLYPLTGDIMLLLRIQSMQ